MISDDTLIKMAQDVSETKILIEQHIKKHDEEYNKMNNNRSFGTSITAVAVAVVSFFITIFKGA